MAADIFAFALYERGFDVYSAEITHSDKEKIAVPHLKKEFIEIKSEHIKQLFGLELKESEIKHLLEKAQFNFNDYKIEIPPYRADILHPFDIVEDIGIMYG